MDRATVAVYERSAAAYRELRAPYRPDRACAFADSLAPGSLRLDLGCGPGHYLPLLGQPIVAADAAQAMLEQVAVHAPGTPLLRCDLTHLPVARGCIAGIWASKAHQHLPAAELPGALAELHRALKVGGRLAMTVFATPESSPEPYGCDVTDADDEMPGRMFTLWSPETLADLLVGAGFELHSVDVSGEPRNTIHLTAERLRTLPDRVGPGMRLLICGLNPSIYSADVGIGFARGGNRFWPAARAAGLTHLDRDPARLLTNDRIGMTDLVKRATVAAAELSTSEYRTGIERLTRLCSVWQPAAVCFVGLAGWRAAVDRRAQPGWQPTELGPSPVYVMPSTSGLNASSRPADLAAHLAAAAAGPPA